MNSFWTGLFFLFFLSGVTAFYVLTEYSLVASRRTRITEMAESGVRGATTVLQVMGATDKFLAGVQVGITLLSIALGVMVEEPISETIRNVLSSFGFNLPETVLRPISTLAALLFATYVSIIIGELIPRAFALQYAEQIACLLVPSMLTVNRFFSPFIWLLNKSSNAILKVLGKEQKDKDKRNYSIEELKLLLSESEAGGVIESEQNKMLHNVFSFGEKTAREVMLPRTEMVSVAFDTTLEEVIHILCANPLDRVPIYKDSTDNIVGILHVKDLVRALYPKSHNLTINQLMRKPFFVPDTQRADELLKQMQERRESMVIVLDEYGGTAGMISLTWLISEIVGVVGVDAPETPDIQKSSDGNAILNGLTAIGDVNNVFDLNITDTNYDTIGGFVMGQLGRIPKVGDEIELKEANIKLRIEEMDRLRVAKLTLIKMM
jgi:putative hemolysin